MVAEVVQHRRRHRHPRQQCRHLRLAPIVEITEKSYDRIFAVNMKGLSLHPAGGGATDDRARAAAARSSTWPRRPAAAASPGRGLLRLEGGGDQLTQSAGLDLIQHRINVNGIAPGVVDTPMWDEVDALFAKYEGRPLGEKKRLVGEAVPYGRMGKPEDHVGAAVFLASPESDYVVAQTFNVDGGNWMS